MNTIVRGLFVLSLSLGLGLGLGLTLVGCQQTPPSIEPNLTRSNPSEGMTINPQPGIQYLAETTCQDIDGQLERYHITREQGTATLTSEIYERKGVTYWKIENPLGVHSIFKCSTIQEQDQTPTFYAINFLGVKVGQENGFNSMSGENQVSAGNFFVNKIEDDVEKEAQNDPEFARTYWPH